jgi:hypothetical protein
VQFTSDNDAAFRQRHFFPNLRISIPARYVNNRGRDELCANVTLAEYLFIEDFQLASLVLAM